MCTEVRSKIPRFTIAFIFHIEFPLYRVTQRLIFWVISRWTRAFLNFLSYFQFKVIAWFSALLSHNKPQSQCLLFSGNSNKTLSLLPLCAHSNQNSFQFIPLFSRHAFTVLSSWSQNSASQVLELQFIRIDFNLYLLRLFMKFGIFHWEFIPLIFLAGDSTFPTKDGWTFIQWSCQT